MWGEHQSLQKTWSQGPGQIGLCMLNNSGLNCSLGTAKCGHWTEDDRLFTKCVWVYQYVSPQFLCYLNVSDSLVSFYYICELCRAFEPLKARGGKVRGIHFIACIGLHADGIAHSPMLDLLPQLFRRGKDALQHYCFLVFMMIHLWIPFFFIGLFFYKSSTH